jgi:hypothetical protein
MSTLCELLTPAVPWIIVTIIVVSLIVIYCIIKSGAEGR